MQIIAKILLSFLILGATIVALPSPPQDPAHPTGEATPEDPAPPPPDHPEPPKCC
ncbi:hypothetical protein PGTUg99_022234 [Puccinia graminis f. sp. tritici]|uniref:Uncharacterized protein n=1 Tax=Puccinia graminis f. sp. tritici TaxID=56615 RepID=A0A5B0SEW0_PUCGR|nr:hypothetical protein PGTUg99_022234 [Puccinia graminis f. sp. tritici]